MGKAKGLVLKEKVEVAVVMVLVKTKREVECSEEKEEVA